MHEILQRPIKDNPHRNAVALYGKGGVGKTQIAIRYAYIYRKDYTSIWWVNAASTATLSEGYVRIAQKLIQYHAREWGTSYATIAPTIGVQRHCVDDKTGIIIDTSVAVEAVKTWLAAEKNTQWLLIIDNYDETESVNVQEFIPNTTTGNLVIISRTHHSVKLGEGIAVAAIPVGDGMEIIRKCAQIDEAKFGEGQFIFQWDI